MSLDHVAARMVMRARQLERALHDPGPWSITVGPHEDQWEIPARKVVGDAHVAFYAVAPLEGDRPIFAELLSKGEVVAVKVLDPVGGPAQIVWTFEVNEASVNA